MRPRAFAAELVGTFALAFSTLISINHVGFPIPTPAMAALTLGVLVHLLGPVSGCLLNPAVTIAIWSVGKLAARDAGSFIVAQFAGAGLALSIGGLLFPDPVPLPVDASAGTGIAEMLGAALLAFTIAAVFMGRVPARLTGAVIGVALVVSISWAAHGSNGVLNPAVALGIGSFSLAYVWGPVVGALIGAHLSRYVCDPGDQG
ncbi:aquaporin [Candidatus Palauibacter sp.]|uniref:aquaporin n=1 Tax=Candidatus Palauibacter sp. TaxID=3101350 RepID=UPI003B0194F4